MSNWYERSISHFLPDSLLLYFAYADYEEVIHTVYATSSFKLLSNLTALLIIRVFSVVMGHKYTRLLLLFGLFTLSGEE